MYTYICGKCKEKLPKNAYHVDSSGKGHHSICKKCRSNNYNILVNMFSGAKRRAKALGVEFSITKQDIMALNESQGGKCKYTGIELNWNAKTNSGKQRVCPPDRVSLDRIDSARGYTKDNIQLVVEFVNRIKAWHPESDVLGFCQKVIDNADNYQ